MRVAAMRALIVTLLIHGAPAFGDEAIRYSLALMMTSHAVAALLFLRAQATLRAGRGAISRSESGAEGA